MRPKSLNSLTVLDTFVSKSWNVLPLRYVSSIYPTFSKPLQRKVEYAGFINFVNILGALLNPLGIDRFHSRDKNLDNRCYAAILVYRNVNKLVASFAWNMVLCLIVSCGSKSGRDKGLYFVRVPSVVTKQGEEAHKISEERRSRWISAISRDDLTEEILENDPVCEKHLF